MRDPRQAALLVTLVVALALCHGCGPPQTGTPPPSKSAAQPGAAKDIRLAYITNGVASFWTVAEAGVRAGEKEFGVRCEVLTPVEGIGHQKRLLEELVVRGVDGIAVSPIAPADQVQLLNEAAQRTILITHDCDAAGSNRQCYIGTDNYVAGRLAGQLVKEALPEGGSVMIFVGRLEQENARLRRQGVIDEVLDRSHDPTRSDPPEAQLTGPKYSVLETRTDQFDYARAKSLAEEAIAKYPTLGCMVGLFAYNPPQCLAAIKEAGKVGKIRVVGFDEEATTLQGIMDGEIYATVVQNPYEYGRKSVEVLTTLVRGDRSVIPSNKYIDVPTRQIRRDNVQAFWADLKAKMGS
jgi:ribose transport system substrate-binding protein